MGHQVSFCVRIYRQICAHLRSPQQGWDEDYNCKGIARDCRPQARGSISCWARVPGLFNMIDRLVTDSYKSQSWNTPKKDRTHLRSNQTAYSWMNEWLIDWLNDWMTDWLNEWMTDWLTDWMNESLIEWMNESNGSITSLKILILII